MGMMINLRRSQMMPREKGQPRNQIWYTTTDGKVVELRSTSGFGATFKSNIYNNGMGIITFDGDITSIGSYILIGCTNLKSFAIPNGVTKIGASAFEDCSSLASITLPEGVTIIGIQAFYGCSSFASITLPEGVTIIGIQAFYGCSSFASITLPEGVTTIGDRAFYNCKSLKSVYCKPTTPPTGGSDMFKNNPSDHNIYVPKASVNAYKAAQYWSGYASYIVGYDF